MKEFYRRYQNKNEKILNILWDNGNKKLVLHSSLSNVLQEAKNAIQNALDNNIRIEIIDLKNYNIERLQSFLTSESSKFLDDEEFRSIELDYFKEKIFIKGHKKSVEELKKMISPFMICDLTKSLESCPICNKKVNESLCLLYNCAHKFCKECFIRHVEVEKSTVSCPKCNEIVTLKDIEELLPVHVIDEIIDKQLQLYLEKHTNIYKSCTIPDCKYIYPIGTEPLKCKGCSELKDIVEKCQGK